MKGAVLAGDCPKCSVTPLLGTEPGVDHADGRPFQWKAEIRRE